MRIVSVFLGILPMLLFSFGVSGQDVDSSTVMNRPCYLKLGSGVSRISFRDFATSPLIYDGLSFYVDGSLLHKDAKRESEFQLAYSTGKNIAEASYTATASLIQTFGGYYSRLYQIPSISNSKWNYKVGGMLHITGNYRYNPSLQNNSVGAEIIGNLMGSFKVERNVSRTKHKDKKIWFVKYHLQPRTKDLAFRFNLGIINSSYRNGYAYIGQSGVVNDPTFYDGYSYNMFSGFRMNTALDYTIHLKNQNAVQFSYEWDAYTTGNKDSRNSFELARHILKVSLLFKTNK